jgi:predicted Rossmann fold flavoprotein
MILNSKNKIAIIGGGPAGMMASIIASLNKENQVYLFEKNNSLGKKLLITGSGRCNITNAESDVCKFIESYGKNGKFLFSSFSQFFNDDLLNFFENSGVKFVVERGGRVFPKSNDANEITNALIEKIKQNKVNVCLGKALKNIVVVNNEFKLIFQNGEFMAHKVIIACGGKSYPGTGSTGEIFEICKKLGHKIIELKPSLVPLGLSENFVKNLEGLSLKNVEASIIKNNKKIIKRFGEMLFTNSGVSGPIIFEISKYIVRENPEDLILSLDLKPALSLEQLNKRIKREILEKNITYKNLLKLLLPIRLASVFGELSKIDENKKIKHLNKQEIEKLSSMLKNFNFHICDLGNFYHSIVTSGGVDIKSINPKTMESKLIPGLYFAGEVIDIDGETGGYNLQAAFSTGFVAGYLM